MTKTIITEMLKVKCSDDDDNKTPIEVSDGDSDVLPYVDLVSYRGQDKIWEKVLKTPHLLKWQNIHSKINKCYIL